MKITNLDDIRLFTAIVEAGTLTLAASQLGVPKSKLSRHLSQLEGLIGSQLLIRTTRRQHLTEAGKLLYRSCKPHVEALEKVGDDIGMLINEPVGKINILLPLEFFSRVMSALIADFASLYPKVNINCQHYSEELPTEDHSYDLIFVLHEMPLTHSNWIGKTLLSFPQSIYASAEYNVDHIHDPEDLVKEVAITTAENQQWLFRDQERIQTVNVNSRMVLSSPEMRLEAAKKKLGLVKLPNYVCQLDKCSADIQRLSLSKNLLAQQLTVIYQSRTIPLKVRAFIDFFQSKVGCLG